jgi:Galanin
MPLSSYLIGDHSVDNHRTLLSIYAQEGHNLTWWSLNFILQQLEFASAAAS